MSQTIRDNLKRMLAPRHLAFIGGRSMARALKRCADGGYLGEMWLVNPQHDSLEGVPCVRRGGGAGRNARRSGASGAC